jgi:hypothetical protein
MPNRRIRFYNAGDRILRTLRYTDPTGHDIHCIANYVLDAPAGDFFSIAEETTFGSAIVRLSFDKDIVRDYGARGVVQVDANYEPVPVYETYYEKSDIHNERPLQRQTDKVDHEADDINPYARNDQEAIAKGRRMWKAFVQARVKEFLEQCEMIRAAAGVPRPASGVMLRYLAIAGVTDPSQAMLLEAKKQTEAIETLNERLERLEN